LYPATALQILLSGNAMLVWVLSDIKSEATLFFCLETDILAKVPLIGTGCVFSHFGGNILEVSK